ncbi:MAG: hypothetical protein B6241_02470 [Spirochaetaceae bacterium 4572_59]|nr:MAG: hypothetical protein B6241_02470 [Spirochaetaceae bacterium 4572_59]
MNKSLFTSRDTENIRMEEYLESLREFFKEMIPIPSGIEPSLISPAFPVKAVLLDIYGTLMISEAGDIGLTAVEADCQSPAKIYSDSEIMKYPYGQIKTILHDLIRKSHTITKQQNQSIEYPEVDIISIWEQLYNFLGLKEPFIEDLIQTCLRFEIQTNKISLMPGTIELLEELADMNIPTGIVSNAQFYTPLFLEYLLKDKLKTYNLNEDISSWSYKIGRGKPDFQIFSKPVKRLKEEFHINPEEILYIGNDMLNDIYTASSCGLKTVLFAGDKRSLRLRKENHKVKDISADCIITDLSQIIPFIRNTIS